MKTCPDCHTSYTDDSLNFCLKDGSALTFVTPTYEMPTVVLGEQETIVRRGNNPLGPDAPATPPGDQGQTGGTASQPKGSNTVFVVLTTVIVMLFIGGLVIAIGFYLNKNKIEPPPNTNRVPGPSPKASVKPSPTASNTNSSSDQDLVKSDIQKKLNLWRSLSEARDLESNLKNYADHVDYYNAKNADHDLIRKDKQKSSVSYDSINIELLNINIIPDLSGEKATIVLDKKWNNTGPDPSAGKVKMQLKMEKIDDDWLITSEKVLKVY